MSFNERTRLSLDRPVKFCRNIRKTGEFRCYSRARPLKTGLLKPVRDGLRRFHQNHPRPIRSFVDRRTQVRKACRLETVALNGLKFDLEQKPGNALQLLHFM